MITGLTTQGALNMLIRMESEAIVRRGRPKDEGRTSSLPVFEGKVDWKTTATFSDGCAAVGGPQISLGSVTWLAGVRHRQVRRASAERSRPAGPLPFRLRGPAEVA